MATTGTKEILNISKIKEIKSNMAKKTALPDYIPTLSRTGAKGTQRKTTPETKPTCQVSESCKKAAAKCKEMINECTKT